MQCTNQWLFIFKRPNRFKSGFKSFSKTPANNGKKEEMKKDRNREAGADAWSENFIGDIDDSARLSHE